MSKRSRKLGNLFTTGGVEKLTVSEREQNELINSTVVVVEVVESVKHGWDSKFGSKKKSLKAMGYNE